MNGNLDLWREAAATPVLVYLSGGDGGAWWILRLVLQVLEKQQTGFSCWYGKTLPWLSEEVLPGYCTQEKEADRKITASCWKEQVPSSSPSLRSSETKKKPVGKAEMWFVGFQPQRHKSKYRRVGLELRELREHTHKRKFTPTPFINGWKKILTKTSAY